LKGVVLADVGPLYALRDPNDALLLEEKRDLSQGEIREAISGNLCRCTGYQGIVEAIRAADQTWERAVASQRKGEG
jgi:xanthine dehydrogenase iron-sulfur cluster and FAD-binding subunit A